jgi:hypothetical protein
MNSDIAFAERTENRIRDRVRERIRIRVSLRPTIGNNFHSAQDQLPSLNQPVRISPYSDP